MASPKGRRQNFYRELTREEHRKTYFVGFRFDELFQPEWPNRLEDVISEFIRRARWRVIGVFKEQREWRRNKFRNTDNYIIGVSGKQGHLGRYIHSLVRNPVVASSDLAQRFGDLSPNDQEAIRTQAEEKLILAALNQMCSPNGTDIWYDQALGIWQLAQSCVDELKLERKRTRAAMNCLGGFHDSRTYHGRNSGQARTRDKANRNAYRSTGFSNQVN